MIASALRYAIDGEAEGVDNFRRQMIGFDEGTISSMSTTKVEIGRRTLINLLQQFHLLLLLRIFEYDAAETECGTADTIRSTPHHTVTAQTGGGGEGFGEDGSVVLVLVYHDGAEAYGVDLWSVEVYGLELGAAEYLVGEEVDG